MEKSLSNVILQAYQDISARGLSAGLETLNHLVKYQHSVSYEEGLLALDYLFQLCNFFGCRDVTELTELFTIYEFWRRQSQTIFLPPDISPHFETVENHIICTLPTIPAKGCLLCSYFDRCRFPRSVNADAFSNAQWRCVSCGNALEFPTAMYEVWITHHYGVTTQFLCCACFLEYSIAGEPEGDATNATLTQILQSPPLLHLPRVTEYPVVITLEDVYLYDWCAVILSLIAMLFFLFDDSGSPFYNKMGHPAPHDAVAWEAMQMVASQFSLDDFPHVANVILRPLADFPILDALFDYCLGVLVMNDFFPDDARDPPKLTLSSNFKDFAYVFVKSEFPPLIVSSLQQSPPAWDKVVLWAEDHFI